MAESALSVKYQDLLTTVGRFLGYSGEVHAWSQDQLNEVDGYVQSGIRQFYYPPAVPGVDPDREWSFLNPWTTIATVADTGEQDLPDDLSRILGFLHFEPEVYSEPVLLISEGAMGLKRQQTSQKTRPRLATVRHKTGTTNAAGQRTELLWWPIPDAAYTLTYQYEAYSGKLSEAYPYPLGGMKHSELIIESCLAIAEQRANDEKGIHSEAFASLLAASIEQDRKTGARFFGHMGETHDLGVLPRRMVTSNYPITYKGVTW